MHIFLFSEPAVTIWVYLKSTCLSTCGLCTQNGYCPAQCIWHKHYVTTRIVFLCKLYRTLGCASDLHIHLSNTNWSAGGSALTLPDVCHLFSLCHTMVQSVPWCFGPTMRQWVHTVLRLLLVYGLNHPVLTLRPVDGFEPTPGSLLFLDVLEMTGPDCSIASHTMWQHIDEKNSRAKKRFFKSYLVFKLY